MSWLPTLNCKLGAIETHSSDFQGQRIHAELGCLESFLPHAFSAFQDFRFRLDENGEEDDDNHDVPLLNAPFKELLMLDSLWTTDLASFI
jgi:hypothetical protein